jgi:hypothetical protein
VSNDFQRNVAAETRSCARYTSPMPPAPSWLRTRYGPTLAPSEVTWVQRIRRGPRFNRRGRREAVIISIELERTHQRKMNPSRTASRRDEYRVAIRSVTDRTRGRAAGDRGRSDADPRREFPGIHGQSPDTPDPRIRTTY